MATGGISRAPGAPKPTPEEQKAQAFEIARKMTEMGYDKEWLKDERNRKVVDGKMREAVVRRPSRVIGAQALAVRPLLPVYLVSPLFPALILATQSPLYCRFAIPIIAPASPPSHPPHKSS